MISVGVPAVIVGSAALAVTIHLDGADLVDRSTVIMAVTVIGSDISVAAAVAAPSGEASVIARSGIGGGGSDQGEGRGGGGSKNSEFHDIGEVWGG